MMLRTHDSSSVNANDKVEPGFHGELGIGVLEHLEASCVAGTLALLRGGVRVETGNKSVQCSEHVRHEGRRSKSLKLAAA
jgi:hypothetical protein